MDNFPDHAPEEKFVAVMLISRRAAPERTGRDNRLGRGSLPGSIARPGRRSRPGDPILRGDSRRYTCLVPVGRRRLQTFPTSKENVTWRSVP